MPNYNVQPNALVPYLLLRLGRRKRRVYGAKTSNAVVGVGDKTYQHETLTGFDALWR